MNVQQLSVFFAAADEQHTCTYTRFVIKFFFFTFLFFFFLLLQFLLFPSYPLFLICYFLFSSYLCCMAENPESLVYKLRNDERHIRVLAVVLSLTGGLALSFILGVGIFLFWHIRECDKRHKRRRRKKTLDLPYATSSKDLQVEQDQQRRQREQQQQQEIPPPPPATTISSRSSVPNAVPEPKLAPTTFAPAASAIPSAPYPVIRDEADTPTPSAPTAKEILEQYHPSPSSSSRHCHQCQIPPPAYTPSEGTRTSDANYLILDPETATAALLAVHHQQQQEEDQEKHHFSSSTSSTSSSHCRN